MKHLLVADLFCGAGGTSTGAEKAIRELGCRMELVAINHWPVAIETHKLNHPTARHYIEDVTVVDPVKIVPEGYLDLLMASPECRGFSRARGGKPIHDQSRMNPWAVIRWLTSLDVRCLLVENVPEYVNWGPLDEHDRPIPEKSGLYFQAWLKAIWELGYQAEFRCLNAADFGDATTRVRFFLIARKDGRAVRWPEPTHSAAGAHNMVAHRPRWRGAREIIDWSSPGRSLLDHPWYQKHPLSLNTRRRIARGLEKFGGALAPYYVRLLGLESDAAGGSASPEPFVMGKQSSPSIRSVGQPLPTCTTDGAINLIEPVVEPFVLGQQSDAKPRRVSEPIPTVAAAGAISLVKPLMVKYYGPGVCHPVDEPVPTITTKDRSGLAIPVIIPYRGERDGQDPRAHSIDDPVPTITAEAGFALANPLLIEVNHNGGDRPRGDRVHSLDAPLGAVTSRCGAALVEPILVQTDQTGGNGVYARPVTAPAPTVVTKNNIALVEPIARKAQGEIDPRRLVLIDGEPYLLDIRFRMLSNLELARAMGFTDCETTYEFVGNGGEVTRQIGNAVPVNVARALVSAILTGPALEQLQPRPAAPAHPLKPLAASPTRLHAP